MTSVAPAFNPYTDRVRFVANDDITDENEAKTIRYLQGNSPVPGETLRELFVKQGCDEKAKFKIDDDAQLLNDKQCDKLCDFLTHMIAQNPRADGEPLDWIFNLDEASAAMFIPVEAQEKIKQKWAQFGTGEATFRLRASQAYKRECIRFHVDHAEVENQVFMSIPIEKPNTMKGGALCFFNYGTGEVEMSTRKRGGYTLHEPSVLHACTALDGTRMSLVLLNDGVEGRMAMKYAMGGIKQNEIPVTQDMVKEWSS